MASTISDSSSGVERKTLGTSDSFMAGGGGGFFDELAKNSKAIIGIVLIVVLAVGAVTFYVSKKEARSSAARSALFDAEKTAGTELKAIAEEVEKAKPPVVVAPNAKDTKGAKDAAKAPKPEAANVDTVMFQKLDVDAKLPESVKKLSAVIQNYGDTRSAFDAEMKLGDLYYNHGEPDKAVGFYQKATAGSPSHIDKALAFSALGYAQENAGKNQDAITSFQHGIDMGELSIKGDLLMGVARNYQALHDATKAKEAYDQILTQFPNSDFARNAQILKSQIE